MATPNRFQPLSGQGGTENVPRHEAQNLSVTQSGRGRESYRSRPRSSTQRGRSTGHALVRSEPVSQPGAYLGSKGADRSQSRGSFSGRGSMPSNRGTNVFGSSYPTTRANFPRISPLNVPTSTKREDRRLQTLAEDQTVLSLRQRPDDEDVSSSMGTFLWPSGETGVETIRTEDPRLDEIRKRYHCHIVLAQNPRRFCVYSVDQVSAEKDISEAMHAIRTFIEQALERTSRCIRFVLTHAPLSHDMTPNVRMLKPQTHGIASSQVARITSAGGTVAIAEPPLLLFEDNWSKDAQMIERKNVLTLELALAKGLERLIVSPGRVELKALLGCFVFTRMSGGNEMPISSFFKRLRDTKTQGSLYRMSPRAELFDRVLARGDLFTAFAAGKDCELNSVDPTYVGVFTFASQGLHNEVHQQFSIETATSHADNGTPNIARRVWTSPKENSSSHRLEAHVVNIEGGLSWKFESTALPFCRNIGEELQRFQARVVPLQRTQASAKPGSTELMFKFPAGYQWKDFYQRTQWRFFVKKNHNYIFQVSRLDRFDLNSARANKTHGITAEMRNPVDTEWEACVYDERWDEILGQNASLNLGERANWNASVIKFFPNEGKVQPVTTTGLSEFVQCVTEICQCLSETKPWE